jgi:acid phosphatase
MIIGRRAAARLTLCGISWLTLAGCASSDTGIDGLNATLWMQQSAEYRGSAEQAYRAAQQMLEEALADPSWTAALEQEGDPSSLPPAVILDVDETVLDNSPFQGRLIREGRTFNPAMWNAWVSEATAPPVPGALAFTRSAAERGITVFYVTNRDSHLEAATKLNLERAGFPIADQTDVLLTRGEREGWGSDKTSRRAHVASHYRIILLAGDDLNDFLSVSRASIEERDQLESAYSGYWGHKWIVLPNPSYGSWERALYGFDSSLDADAQRELKAGRLETGEASQDEPPR